MVRHLRDPVTGVCTVCGPSHGKATPSQAGSSAGWGVVQTNTYGSYGSGYGQGGRPPSPGMKHQGQNVYMHNSRHAVSPSGVRFADQHDRSPSPYGRGRRDRSPSPEPGCCGGSSRRGYDDRGRGRDRNMQSTPHGKVDPHGRGGTSRGGCWGRRRCCAILLAILLLLLLAGLAVGLYFGITAAQTQAAANAPNALVPGGTYYNGLYAVPVTQNPSQNYWVLGADTPCNPFNNNTNQTNPLSPINCANVTTVIQPANANFTPTPTPVPTPVPVAITTIQASASNISIDRFTFCLAFLLSSTISLISPLL